MPCRECCSFPFFLLISLTIFEFSEKSPKISSQISSDLHQNNSSIIFFPLFLSQPAASETKTRTRPLLLISRPELAREQRESSQEHVCRYPVKRLLEKQASLKRPRTPSDLRTKTDLRGWQKPRYSAQTAPHGGTPFFSCTSLQRICKKLKVTVVLTTRQCCRLHTLVTSVESGVSTTPEFASTSRFTAVSTSRQKLHRRRFRQGLASRRQRNT